MFSRGPGYQRRSQIIPSLHKSPARRVSRWGRISGVQASSALNTSTPCREPFVCREHSSPFSLSLLSLLSPRPSAHSDIQFQLYLSLVFSSSLSFSLTPISFSSFLFFSLSFSSFSFVLFDIQFQLCLSSFTSPFSFPFPSLLSLFLLLTFLFLFFFLDPLCIPLFNSNYVYRPFPLSPSMLLFHPLSFSSFAFSLFLLTFLFLFFLLDPLCTPIFNSNCVYPLSSFPSSFFFIPLSLFSSFDFPLSLSLSFLFSPSSLSFCLSVHTRSRPGFFGIQNTTAAVLVDGESSRPRRVASRSSRRCCPSDRSKVYCRRGLKSPCENSARPSLPHPPRN